VIRAHGGTVDKFLGDGIMATFGATRPSARYAADAIGALLACLVESKAWEAERRTSGLPPLSVNGAVATGRVVFGAVGDSARLEYTVIGDAVNLAAKLEKHNKRAGSRGLATKAAVALAEEQGWRPVFEPKPLPGSQLSDLPRPVDLVALA
jgi:adenylate cyclase